MARRIYTPKASNTLSQSDQIRLAAGYPTYKAEHRSALKRARRTASRG